MSVITWVLEIKEPLKSMKERLLKLGAIPGKSFHVDYLNYKPIKPGCYPMGILHHSNFPLTSFLVGTRSAENKVIHMIGDLGLDAILSKLKGGLIPEYNASFECSGMEYTYQDYILRLGVASMANSATKGTIIEIGFRPFWHTTECLVSVIEFTKELLNDGEERYPTYLEQRLYRYASVDILQQYKDIFTEMRRRTVGTTENTISTSY